MVSGLNSARRFMVPLLASIPENRVSVRRVYVKQVRTYWAGHPKYSVGRVSIPWGLSVYETLPFSLLAPDGGLQ